MITMTKATIWIRSLNLGSMGINEVMSHTSRPISARIKMSPMSVMAQNLPLQFPPRKRQLLPLFLFLLCGCATTQEPDQRVPERWPLPEIEERRFS